MTTTKILTIGNPNCGKTTLFNGLTGSQQKVGNWAGVTVDKKQGQFTVEDTTLLITDLPGLYHLENDLGDDSLDESIAAHAILSHDTDWILNVVDATNLERSLYLTLQLRELGRPMMVLVNKMDALKRQGQTLDLNRLSDALQCPVLALSATDLKQCETLKRQLQLHFTQTADPATWSFHYGDELETLIAALTPQLPNIEFNGRVLPPRALAIRLLENDLQVHAKLTPSQQGDLQTVISAASLSEDRDLLLADARYQFLYTLCQDVRQTVTTRASQVREKIDRVLLHSWFGLPFFFFVMYLMFMFAINIGSAFIDFFDITAATFFVELPKHYLSAHLPEWLMTLIADGIGGGIQTVATFIPVIACLYLFMTLLESLGYMARAAFVLDKGMQYLGLPGKAFVPLVLGFGCNVPAIMATRTLDQERERKLAAAMAPFMSCGARLPVYALFAAAFFPEHAQNLVFALYLLGVVVAVLTGLLLRHTLYPGSSDRFLMELPDYEWPTWRNVFIKTWQKLKRFVFGAGKTIVVVVMCLSFLNSLGTDGKFGHEDSQTSILSKAAQTVTPIFAPMGIEQENWPATVGIITGIFAKEAVVGTLNALYAPSEGESDANTFSITDNLTEAVTTIKDNLSDLNLTDPLGIQVGEMQDKTLAAEEQGVEASVFANIQSQFVTASAAMAYLVFILLYTPCAAAMGAYVREFGQTFAWAIGAWTLALGYFGGVLCYQTAQLGVTPVSSTLWITGILALFAGLFWILRQKGKQVSVTMPLQTELS